MPCHACGGVLTLDIGQFIDRGRLWWDTSGSCQSCDTVWCEEDSGRVTPDAIRQALLARHGSARLRLTEPEASSAPILRALREAHDVTLTQAKALADELKATGLTGTLVEMELLADRLRQRSVMAAVEQPGC
ncbi:hypothetical protein H9Y04_08235 [Streptomyces sp. TRM66268-LWL]|uniref:Uncharacterized protein n=1 Tax=Streptomyces polyasparticus TaxID=2767826 RepID=A0ABR7SAR0_9ACTN|nr:hypothetical protein [Streptomyces polyasparticus]